MLLIIMFCAPEESRRPSKPHRNRPQNCTTCKVKLALQHIATIRPFLHGFPPQRFGAYLRFRALFLFRCASWTSWKLAIPGPGENCHEQVGNGWKNSLPVTADLRLCWDRSSSLRNGPSSAVPGSAPAQFNAVTLCDSGKALVRL